MCIRCITPSANAPYTGYDVQFSDMWRFAVEEDLGHQRCFSMTYSDYFDAKRKIEKLKALSDQGAKPDEFVPLLEALFFDKMEIKGFDCDQTIYRARMNEHGRLFADSSELKHPSSSRRKGRMNEVGESFFYGGICELGNIYELVPNIGSLFTVSRAVKHRAEEHLMFYIAGLIDDDQRSPKPRNSTEKIIYDYLHGELTKVTANDEEYNSTIAISKVLLNKGLVAPPDYVLCGLAYPSVQLAKGVANVRTFNIGMNGDIFDQKFRIKEAFVYCLTHELEAGTYQLNPVNHGKITEDDRIVWECSFVDMQQRMWSGLTLDGVSVENLKKYADGI